MPSARTTGKLLCELALTLVCASCGTGTALRAGASAVGSGKRASTSRTASRFPAVVGQRAVAAQSGSSDVPATVIVRADTYMPGTQPIPSGFLGISTEYPSVEDYAGSDPRAINPVFVQLIRNLGPTTVLRIGGDSTDRTWWPVNGLTKPPGVTFALDRRWLAVTRALTRALRTRITLGINLEAGSPQIAAAEARALRTGIGAHSIQAFELGNEPELYGMFAWYRKPGGRGVPGRPHNYDYSAFARDFAAIGAAVSGAPLAGPSLGGRGWTGNLPQFLEAEPRVGVVTLHRYPLQRCFTKPAEPDHPTIANLMSNRASAGLADSFADVVRVAHAHGLPLRIDELNTVACGADPSVSRTFASALWSLDTLFQMARVGADGVDVHTFPSAGYNMFTFKHTDGRWSGSVAPQYYGLLMFAQAAPAGSRLLSVSVRGQAGRQLKVWVTVAPDGHVRVVLINKLMESSRGVAIRIPGVRGSASMSLLQAPRITASTGVTLGGQSLGPSTDTGTLRGSATTDPVQPSGGSYRVTLPPASAALVTFGRS